jgi:hypothetical protein
MMCLFGIEQKGSFLLTYVKANCGLV